VQLRLLRRWQSLPALLAFALLFCQAVLPWTGSHFVTQDGPSHLYTAVVAKELLLNPQSPYHSVYRLQGKLVTNWSTIALLNALVIVVGPQHAEKALITLSVVLGFFGLAYFTRALDGQGSPWSPVLNFLLSTWFLWIGFHNFYLGVALVCFVVGYYIRHARELNGPRALALAGALLLLFFTHVFSAGLALALMAPIAGWTYLLTPDRLRMWRPAVWTAAAVAPVLILSVIFLRAAGQDTTFLPDIEYAWNNFPMRVFAASRGRASEMLQAAMLFYMVLGVLLLRSKEWVTARGAVFVAAALMFCAYLLVPNAGFGGGEVKVRFAWAVFLFGCVAAWTVPRMRLLRIPMSIYVAAFLAVMLAQTMRQNVRGVSQAVRAYAAAMESIPDGATFVRVRFETEATRRRFGFQEVSLDPLYHVDAWVAAQRGLVDLTDYQAISSEFPVDYKPHITDQKQLQLWLLEGTVPDGVYGLQELLTEFPAAIDYVVVVGDSGAQQRPAEFAGTLARLDATMRLVSTDPERAFVRVYARRFAMQDSSGFD
jgi:hypothetical protein